MTAPGLRRSGRFHLSEAIARMVADKGTSHIGRLLGVDRGTVGDKGSDLHRWRADELLILAEQDEALGNALVATIRSEPTPALTGEAVALQSDLMDELADDAAIDGAIIAALAGKASVEKLTEVEARILKRRAHDEKLLADIAAAKVRS